jgi:bifunctional non-homologous end joining protein LigD
VDFLCRHFIHHSEEKTMKQNVVVKPVQQTSLFFQSGSSDKEYHAEIVPIEAGYAVNFRYGRRGGTLTCGTKTAAPVELAAAQKLYTKLIADKTSKGYVAADSVATNSAYQSSQTEVNKSDFNPQLLNPVSEDEALRLIQDDHYAAQQKMDGERRAAHADGNGVVGMNRKGLIVPLPQAIVDELQSIHDQTGAIRIDGELIGDMLYVFDMHIHQGVRLHFFPWTRRMELAEAALTGCQFIQTVPVAHSTRDKRALWEQVKSAHGEGVVFKRRDCQVSKVRPNSSGDWLKFKFTESASCWVVEINAGKRSVKLGLLDANNSSKLALSKSSLIPVGNVTIPVNYDIPKPGEIVEVEYLYAYLGGSLYQPVYRGKRGDVEISECTTAQLKYKPETVIPM